MTLGTLLLIVVILLLIGVIPTWPHSKGWGRYGGIDSTAPEGYLPWLPDEEEKSMRDGMDELPMIQQAGKRSKRIEV